MSSHGSFLSERNERLLGWPGPSKRKAGHLKPSALNVVTNWQGEPLCVIETKAVAIVPFERSDKGSVL